MKSIMMKQTIFAVTAGLLLSACGGGSSSSSDSIPPPGDTTPPPGDTTPPPTIVQVPQCGTAADLEKSNTIDVTGKTIKKVVNGAKVRIWHDPDGTKSACMITGEATVK
ncbi:hypothetical protein ACLHDG_04430 [Sulfurovum sp. CS9]|uniref:hypothetical protein n=1 Tax=Sulfurovum sp. CS9 TaxID=3391146 RepID=UPI0039E9D033